jgi:hypothetical protein
MGFLRVVLGVILKLKRGENIRKLYKLESDDRKEAGRACRKDDP